MKSILAAIKRAPKRAGAISIVAAAVIVPATMFAWGPDNRPTYTYESPADHVTFNSMTGTPNYGDERNFVRIKEATAPNSTYVDDINLQAGKEYSVMVYYHNNAKTSLNSAANDFKGIATNTKMRVQMPATVKAGQEAVITGFVTADNAQPKSVWDEAKGTVSSNVALRYVPNSATVYSNGAINGTKLPETLYTSAGTHLGYDALDGKVPGCNQYAGFVVFKIKVDQPNFEVAKTVSEKGKNDYKESVTAAPGAEVEYKIHYKNSGTTVQNNVVIKDTLPAGMTYVAGSTHVSNSASNNQWTPTTSNGIVAEDGLNIGNYAAGGNAWVKFTAKVNANDDLEACGENTLVNKATAETSNGNKSDTANVVVTKVCEEPEVPPVTPETPEKPPVTPELPKELPKTGMDTILSLFGLGSIVAAASYYVTGRRN